MIGLLILVVGVSAAFTKYEDVKNEPPADWKQTITAQTEGFKQELSQAGTGFDNTYRDYLEQQVAMNEYRLENDINPYIGETTWTYVESNAGVVTFIGLFAIIIAAGIVASEFTWGTIKLLLIRPISRTKILLSKYITVLLFGVSLLAILFLSSLIVGLILFGIDGTAPHLVYIDGNVEEQNIIGYLIKTYFLKTIDVLMMATMAFMISAVFRSSSLALGISLFLLFMGGTATGLLSMRFDWAKYSLFANTDLTQYTGASQPLVEGMTMGFSITMLVVYFLIFHLLAFVVFNKRDIAA
jgi:ABC-2 type transport system permease protein